MVSDGPLQSIPSDAPHRKVTSACTKEWAAANLMAGTCTLIGIDLAWLGGLLAMMPVAAPSCGLQMPLGLTVSGLCLWSLFLSMSIGLLCWNLWRPRTWLYAPLAMLHYIWFAVLSQEPFTEPCGHRQMLSQCELDLALEHAGGQVSLRRRFDCSPDANTQMFVMLTLIILSPCIVPTFRLMFLTWIWLICAIAYVFLSRHQFAAEFFNLAETCVKCGILVLANLIACFKRYDLERAQKKQGLDDERQQEASRKIYEVLEYMLPLHVIGPMLRDPHTVIAEQLACASILFITIENFEAKVGALEPYQLLHFLNQHFTRIDTMCYENQVMKIETVGEEYVAAVGITPEDHEEAKQSGHAVLLGRLVQVAREIFQCEESRDIEFKMGVHTGPILAGVIGQKLPRFRLFGDTINTAARMMQTGLPGHCQFGLETRRSLPQDIIVERRGLVSMKGKGEVETFFLVIPNRKSRAMRRSSLPMRQSLVHRLSDLSGDSSFDDKVGPLNDGFAQRRREAVFAGVGTSNSAMGSSPSRNRSSRRNSQENFTQLLVDIEDVEHDNPTATMKKRCMRWHPFRDCFSMEVEENWYMWYHCTIICNGIQMRIGKHFLLFLLLTILQCVYGFVMWARTGAHSMWHGHRLVIFLVSNTGAFVILGAWQLMAMINRGWLSSRPWKVQGLLMVSYAATGFCIFFSCDALTRPAQVVVCDSPQVDVCMSKLEDAAREEARKGWSGEEWSLVAVLMYSAWNMVNPLLFLQACALACLTIIFVIIVDSGALMTSLYFSAFAQCCFCVCLAINAAYAHRAESASRTRYKTIHTLSCTQARIQGILDSLMPSGVIEQLKAHTPEDPLLSHHYDSVTLAQSDLVGFTKLASQRVPSEVVEIIGKLFGRFDDLTDKHGLCKVETVGDAYLAGQGPWPLTKTHVPADVILFCLEVVQVTIDFARQNKLAIGCRMGVSYGECVGGIVGSDMQRYHLFGSLVHCVELLESTSPEGRVQVGCACHQALELAESTEGQSNLAFDFEEREGPALITSKREHVSFEAVGGRPYLVVG